MIVYEELMDSMSTSQRCSTRNFSSTSPKCNLNLNFQLVKELLPSRNIAEEYSSTRRVVPNAKSLDGIDESMCDFEGIEESFVLSNQSTNCVQPLRILSRNPRVVKYSPSKIIYRTQFKKKHSITLPDLSFVKDEEKLVSMEDALTKTKSSLLNVTRLQIKRSRKNEAKQLLSPPCFIAAQRHHKKPSYIEEYNNQVQLERSKLLQSNDKDTLSLRAQLYLILGKINMLKEINLNLSKQIHTLLLRELSCANI